MSIGFGVSTTTQKSYIKNFLKQSKSHNCHEKIKSLQAMWLDSYSSRKYDKVSIEELLFPEKKEYEHNHNPKVKWNNKTHEGIQLIDEFSKGIWRIDTQKQADGSYDFTASVLYNNVYCFQPDAIEHLCIMNYGKDIYKKWKEMVKENIDDLRFLIEKARETINYTCPSVTCCRRSALLCKEVGITVKGDIAFLFPSKVR